MFLATIIIAILAVSYCGDAFSVDDLMRRKGWLRPVVSRRSKGEYRWPIRLIWVMITLAFCAAVVSKLRNSGLVEYVSSDYIASVLVYHGYTGNRGGYPLIDWLPFWIAGKPFVHRTLAVMTIFLEAGAPLALLHPYLRLILLPMLFMMVLSFWITMGIPFPDMLATFVFWIPWDSLAGRSNLRRTAIEQGYSN